ncbi:FAD-dependent oxidoreductase [Lacisediminihabitans profunda]|uniref:NAD(P)/FAD-dependent oxidoreductase n=1 Tax=Lacisediminihabitans profunda TaxID=2594790 RepID=A0A5C8UQY4_9MICO|nr:FAD-dependent oxidoreductase [Lacisediminihabitans profunda]TXN30644.1 NAD(P)/FAD-dependent oxidoreductase [Lacisediminihabitans profunda]
MPTPAQRRAVLVISATSGAARESVLGEIGKRYSEDYGVVATATAVEAVAALRAAADRGDTVALILADDHSPLPGGGTVFTEARRLFPDVRRALLIEWGAWAESETADAVLRLMEANQIDYYVISPRRSPDEYFHHTVTDFLLEWRRASGERPRDITVVGSESAPRTHEIRRLLTRAGRRVDVVAPDSGEARALLAGVGATYAGVPLVRLADGRLFTDPTNAQLAETNGLTTDLPTDTVDLAVVGAGPGGLAAAVYAASEGLNVVVIEHEAAGGQAGSSSLIRNYLGFARGISGADLSERAYQQAWAFGARFAHTREVVGMSVEPDGFRLEVAPDDHLLARSVVLASGVTYRRITVPELAPFVGSAVFYGASAVEAKAQTGRIVHIVGGGNSAGQAALHLARYAASVSLIVRGANLAESMSRYLVDQLEASGVHILTEQRVIGGGGVDDGSGARLDHLVLRHRVTGVETTVASDALFITIGAVPHTGWLADGILRDQWGYVITGNDIVSEGGRRAWPYERPPAPLESSVAGFFAVGDVRRGSIKRVASAVGEGSVVVSSVHAFLASLPTAPAARR